MELSVVIPCRNNAATIGSQLAALSRQQWRGAWEVIVADNGSIDGTVQVAERYRSQLPDLRTIDASARQGAGHARNAGTAAAHGAAILFCDADDEVGNGWLAAMARGLRCHLFVAARLDITKLNRGEVTRVVQNPQHEGLQRVAYPPRLCHASGASLGVRKKIHERAGGFDENLPYLEDTDYCFRLQRDGIPLQFLSDAVVHYRFKNSGQGLFQQARRWGQYNALMYKRYGRSERLADPWRRHLSRWRVLMRRVPRLVDQEQRMIWMKTLGTQVGVLYGSIKYGVPLVAGC